MRSLAVVVVAVCVSACLGLQQDFAEHLFNGFKKTHGKIRRDSKSNKSRIMTNQF